MIDELVGRTVLAVRIDDENIWLDLLGGETAHFFHAQDCCESVSVEDVNGDWSDLIGTPLLVAEERIRTDSNGEPAPDGCEARDESNTWTFYTFRTIKGSVDVRWHGSSNGYYSESVELHIGKTK